MIFSDPFLNHKRKYSLYILLFFLSFFNQPVFAQEKLTLDRQLDWKEKTIYLIDNEQITISSFDNASIDFSSFPTPYFHETFFAETGTEYIISVKNLTYEPELHQNIHIPDKPVYYVNSSVFQGMNAYDVVVFPYHINSQTNQAERIVSFTIEIDIKRINEELLSGKKTYRSVTQSILAEGEWYMLKVKESGIYKIDYNFLKNMGIDPSKINPKKIRIYGFGGGMLPMPNKAERPEDLIENAIYVSGQEDNVFNPDDFILFYGESPHQWYYDSTGKVFKHFFHYYSDYNCYFLTISQDEGLRISEIPSLTETPQKTISDYIWLDFHEKVMRTEINDYVKSGRDWFGEELKTTSTLSVSFNVPDINKAYPVSFISYVAGRSSSNSSFTINIHGNNFTQYINSVNTGDYLANYCATAVNRFSFLPVKNELDFVLTYNKPNSNAIGWLNYISVNARANLKLNSGQLIIYDTLPLNKVSELSITSSLSDFYLWDVTTKCLPASRQKVKNGNIFSFRIKPVENHHFIACAPGSEYTPLFSGKIANQNLHGIANVDMVIISYPEYLPQANKLADFRRKNDTLSVFITTPQQIYNEFSSGVQDITAIRDFLRHIYKNNTQPEKQLKYVLLIGDASYDYRDVLTGNTNRIPTFQSLICYSPISSYASDDFYGFLDDSEGNFDDLYASMYDKMDIAIGRLPVSTKTEAENVVNKIIHYYSTASMGNWRNNILFVSDDVDDGGFNAHIEHSEVLSNYLSNNVKNLNINKVYMDAYQQVSSSNGPKYPEAQKAISEQVEKGNLVVNYIGHGGEVGWAHERVLEISDINSWENIDKLPVFVTATCEFSRYDDPARVSAGELVLLNPKGGAVALLTTSRVVYVQANEVLTTNLYKDNFFERKNGLHKRLGDILIETKNKTGFSDNTRKFILLGDPSMKLAYPDYIVKALSVPDTFRALEKINISGQVEDIQGNRLVNFNGKVNTTIFDKASTIKTLDNDHYNKSVAFRLMNNVIFQGVSSVDSGMFNFTFIVPKDISYAEDFGKISFYATNNQIDGSGYYDNFIVGGTSDSIFNDQKGPSVRVFIGDSNFISGGITGENPLLYVIVYDPSGINTVGNGIGHEILGYLDNEDPIVLNPYYQSRLNSYKEGEIYYQLTNLSEGKHSMVVKVWDVHNNSATGSVDFEVVKSDEPAIENVFTYPNPFNQSTIVSFEHNLSGQVFDVKIDILSAQGQIVKTISGQFSGDASRNISVEWNPNKDFGKAIESGVYFITVSLTTRDGKKAVGRCKTIFFNGNN